MFGLPSKVDAQLFMLSKRPKACRRGRAKSPRTFVFFRSYCRGRGCDLSRGEGDERTLGILLLVGDVVHPAGSLHAGELSGGYVDVALCVFNGAGVGLAVVSSVVVRTLPPPVAWGLA